MIKIDLEACCYDCERFSIEVDEADVMTLSKPTMERVATVKCGKSDVCRIIRKDDQG